mmetsp:Transcript_32612/g.97321  ORF Transcript_32612/g.97321 Transcript_32612/m.97321 type:complete len:103 (+) Transcript_32612:676-984(+)
MSGYGKAASPGKAPGHRPPPPQTLRGRPARCLRLLLHSVHHSQQRRRSQQLTMRLLLGRRPRRKGRCGVAFKRTCRVLLASAQHAATAIGVRLDEHAGRPFV